MFNPLKYQFTATYLADQNEHAHLHVRRGTLEGDFLFPKNILPAELQMGASFTLTIQPEESAKQSDTVVLKQLLDELIR